MNSFFHISTWLRRDFPGAHYTSMWKENMSILALKRLPLTSVWQTLCAKRHSFNPLPQSPIAVFTYLIFTGVSRVDLIIKPEVSNSHPVLCESPCLVGADDGGRTECFYSFQVLHQTVLLRHPFGCQRQAHLAEVKKFSSWLVRFSYRMMQWVPYFC